MKIIEIITKKFFGKLQRVKWNNENYFYFTKIEGFLLNLL